MLSAAASRRGRAISRRRRPEDAAARGEVERCESIERASEGVAVNPIKERMGGTEVQATAQYRDSFVDGMSLRVLTGGAWIRVHRSHGRG